jgi:hypothetical protein
LTVPTTVPFQITLNDCALESVPPESVRRSASNEISITWPASGASTVVWIQLAAPGLASGSATMLAAGASAVSGFCTLL